MPRHCDCCPRLEWEPSAAGPHPGVVWICPRFGIGLSVYRELDPAGFHVGRAVHFRDPEEGRRIIEELFRLFPMARVPR